MDFVSDALEYGRRLKGLTIMDDFNRESSGRYVTKVLDRVARFRGLPRSIGTGHGPEFTGKALDQ
jgi:putative transposase